MYTYCSQCLIDDNNTFLEPGTIIPDSFFLVTRKLFSSDWNVILSFVWYCALLCFDAMRINRTRFDLRFDEASWPDLTDRSDGMREASEVGKLAWYVFASYLSFTWGACGTPTIQHIIHERFFYIIILNHQFP
jgi:hypothetical protein